MDQDELMRLRTGVDRIEIHELSNRYAHAIDFMDWRLLEDVFTEDAVADYSSAGVLHSMTNPLVELDGPVARPVRAVSCPAGR